MWTLLCLLSCTTETIQVTASRRYFPRGPHVGHPALHACRAYCRPKYPTTVSASYSSASKSTFFFLWCYGPTRAMASSFLWFLDHTQLRITVGTTPLDEWSARRRDLCLTTHNTHKRQTVMPPVGFEPTTSAGERPQTYALDHAATGTGRRKLIPQHITLSNFYKSEVNKHGTPLAPTAGYIGWNLCPLPRYIMKITSPYRTGPNPLYWSLHFFPVPESYSYGIQFVYEFSGRQRSHRHHLPLNTITWTQTR